jgi:putative ABC transport system permease protein
MLPESINGLWLRIKALFRRRQLDRDLDDELAFHLAMREQKLAESGVTAEEAPHAARRQFGNATRAKEANRELWTFPFAETLWQDIRYGVRMLRKSPGFTIVAIVTLALGIGANTAIFSMVEAVLLRPLPYPHGSQLVEVSRYSDVFDFGNQPVSLPDLADVRKQCPSFERLAPRNYEIADMTGHGLPEQLWAVEVPPDFFPLLGVAPLYGRTFLPSEAQPGHDDVVILGAAVWRKYFDADPHVIGRSIQLNGASYTIIGVMPPQLTFSIGANLWIPLVPTPAQSTDRGDNAYFVLGRLAPGSTIAQARAELNTIAARLARAFPKADKGLGFRVRSMKSDRVRDASTPLLILFGAVGLVLLIACANVGNLYLVRSFSRTHELAIRAALGATRGRLVRQLLIEGLLLALAGGAAGLLLAAWAMDGLRSLVLLNTPRLEHLTIDAHVLWFTLGASLAAGIVFSLVPAFLVSRDRLVAAVREAGSGHEVSSAGPRRSRLRQLLVVGEVALALVLVVAAGLMLRSFARLSAVPLGFRPDRVLTMEIDFRPHQFKTQVQFLAYSRGVLEKVRAVPGVESASASLVNPLTGGFSEITFGVEGRPQPSNGQGFKAGVSDATPGYFRTLGIPILAGRGFNESDLAGSPRVVIVNRAFARRFFGSESAIGQHISSHGGWAEIVGEVGNVRDSNLSRPPGPLIYFPYNQRGSWWMTVLVRTKIEPMALAQAVKDRIWSIDKDVPITQVRTMDRVVAAANAEPRSQSLLLSLFGALGLGLALVGIYGVISYSVGCRTREIGIRIALGAQDADVLRLVVGQGAGLVLAGVAIGLAASFAATRLMRGLLYGVSTTDPFTFAGVSILVVLAGLAACYIPARRAMRVDPVTALKCE